MEAGEQPPEEQVWLLFKLPSGLLLDQALISSFSSLILPQVAAKPDPENGGSCNSGDEGIDTTEPVDDIEGTETSNEPVGDVSESDPSVPDEKIEGNDIQDEKQQDQEKHGVIEDDTVQEEVKEEDESPKREARRVLNLP